MKLPDAYFWRALCDWLCVCVVLMLIAAAWIVVAQSMVEGDQWKSRVDCSEGALP